MECLWRGLSAIASACCLSLICGTGWYCVAQHVRVGRDMVFPCSLVLSVGNPGRGPVPYQESRAV
jgi:hypothetical protein